MWLYFNFNKTAVYWVIKKGEFLIKAINKEEALKIANQFTSLNNGTYWDNDEERWYFDSEDDYDKFLMLVMYVMENC